MLFPVMIKVWAGQDPHDVRYIRRSLPSLLRSQLPDEAHVVLVDDCSPNPAILPYLKQLAAQYPRVSVRKNPQPMGPNKGQEYNVPLLWEEFPSAPYMVFCDDDVIYHPGWLQRLIRIRKEAIAVGLDGIFTALNTSARPSFRAVNLPTSKVLLKERQMALNWLVPRGIYDRVGAIRDTGIAYDTDYCNRTAALGIPIICLQPSWVQNIGYHGAYQHDDTLTAHDFVGKRDPYQVMCDGWYRVRRFLINQAERIPEGRFKASVKYLARPARRLLGF